MKSDKRYMLFYSCSWNTISQLHDQIHRCDLTSKYRSTQDASAALHVIN